MQQKITQIVGLAIAIAIAMVLANYLNGWLSRLTAPRST